MFGVLNYGYNYSVNNFYIRGISIFLNDLEWSMSKVCYNYIVKNNGNKTEKTFKNEQRSKDAAAKKDLIQVE